MNYLVGNMCNLIIFELKIPFQVSKSQKYKPKCLEITQNHWFKCSKILEINFYNFLILISEKSLNLLDFLNGLNFRIKFLIMVTVTRLKSKEGYIQKVPWLKCSKNYAIKFLQLFDRHLLLTFFFDV